MTALRALLADRKRSQQGSVLSGVLIMTAFIAIIAGALMTELSGTFLVSKDLMNRVQNQATISSAVELSVSQLQAAQLYSPCPALGSLSLNGQTTQPTYARCWPMNRESQSGSRVGASSSAFNLDGVQVQGNGFSDYLVGNSSGSIFDYRFGAFAPRWTLQLTGTFTAPPLAVAIASNQAVDAFPITGPACNPSNSTNCIDVRTDNNSGSQPSSRCIIAATGGPVVSQPGASPSTPGYVYYGAGSSLEVSDLSGGDCDPLNNIATSQPVVAGPVALRCILSCGHVSDYVYVVVGDSGSSHLLRYTLSSTRGLSLAGSIALPWPNVSGIAASANSLPATGSSPSVGLAITSGGGGIELLQLAASGGWGPPTSKTVPGGIVDDPYWCSVCGNLLGVGAQNGVLYLYDSSLNLTSSYVTGSRINTSPGTDGAGNWYVGTDDGYLRELQLQAGQGLVQVETYGRMGQFGSSAQVAPCTTGICIYFGAADGNVYLVPLDARDTVINACISGANQCLWAQLEIGAAGNRQAVHVQGWSYYSG